MATQVTRHGKYSEQGALMMTNVVNICPASNVSGMLRLLADRIDNENLDVDSLTLVMGEEVHSFGQVHGDQSALHAIWDLERGKHILMTAVDDGFSEGNSND